MKLSHSRLGTLTAIAELTAITAVGLGSLLGVMVKFTVMFCLSGSLLVLADWQWDCLTDALMATEFALAARWRWRLLKHPRRKAAILWLKIWRQNRRARKCLSSSGVWLPSERTLGYWSHSPSHTSDTSGALAQGCSCLKYAPKCGVLASDQVSAAQAVLPYPHNQPNHD